MMFMKSVLRELPYLENWRWLSRRIRCALDPDEPRLIEHYLAEGRYLVCCTETSPWTVALTAFRLLLDTACDRMLPGIGVVCAWTRPGVLCWTCATSTARNRTNAGNPTPCSWPIAVCCLRFLPMN